MNFNRHIANTVIAGQAVGGQFAATVRTEAAGSSLYTDPRSSRPEWAERQVQRHLRGHDFYPPADQLSRIPEKYGTEGGPAGMAGKICHARYFSPVGSFMVVELDRGTGEAFGIFTDRHGDSEMTYLDLPTAEGQRAVQHGLPVIMERDLDFEPQRASTALPAELGGKAVQRLDRVSHRALESQYEAWRTHQLSAHAPEFDVTTIEQHHQQAQELEALWQRRAEHCGVVLHSGDVTLPFRNINSTNRGDWVDQDVEELRQR